MINIMRKHIKIMLMVLIIISIVNPQIVNANKTLVFDDAGLFNLDQIQQLDLDANSLSEEYGLDIVIVTTDNTGGKSSREYADDFYDNGGFGTGYGLDGILFLIDTDNREAYISTSGDGIRYLTDERIERVLDNVFDSGLSNGDYYGAALGFLKGTRTYLERGIPSDQYNEPEPIPKKRITLRKTIFSIIAGIVTSSIFFITTKTSYKMKKSPSYFAYKNNSIVNFHTNDNRLVNTFVTHRIIPKPTNNSNSGSSSGRSSTHTSSSGKTHGGGGRKF